MRVLVTGGAGFIGSNLVRACLAAGDEVRVFDDLSTGRSENLADVEPDIDFIKGSIVELNELRRAVRDREVIYHQAALPSVPRSVADPLTSHAVNATGTLNLLQAARDAGVRRVIYASSSSAYGETEILPKEEAMAPDPVSPYALQKVVGEFYCRQFSNLYGLETVTLRYFNVFGPRQDPGSAYAAVIPNFASAVLSGRQPCIYGDGLQSRDFTYVSDVVAANRAAAVGSPESAGEIVNIARGDRTSLLELLAATCSAAGRTTVEPIFEPARVGDVRHSQADIRKAERLLGWSPRVTLEEGLKQTIQFMAEGPGS